MISQGRNTNSPRNQSNPTVRYQAKEQQHQFERKRKPFQLTVNVDSSRDENMISIGNNNSGKSKTPLAKCKIVDTLDDDNVYRMDGLSIGYDYLRCEGLTITRGELLSTCIDIQEIIGKGAFSTVYRALWTRKPKDCRTTALSTNSNNDDMVLKENVTKKSPRSANEKVLSRQQTHESADTIVLEEVAIKQFSLVHTSVERKSMLLRELRTLCKMNHSNLVRFYGSYLTNTDDQIITLVFEYVPNGSLDTLIHRMKDIRCNKGRARDTIAPVLSEPLIASIGYQILLGLDYLHSYRMIHRDIKPVNILLNYTSGYVKLCDFGISSFLQPDTSLSTTVIGTTKYMSPERLRARPYGRPSDIWSLGLTLIECITGMKPWDSISSIVDLVIAVEECNITDPNNNDLISRHEYNIQDRLFEIIVGTLQQEPNRRIPANLLLHSPWFDAVHAIHSVQDATDVMKNTLAKEFVSTKE